MYSSIQLLCLGSAAETLLCTPIIRAIKTTYPDARLSVTVADPNQHLLDGNIYLDEIDTYQNYLKTWSKSRKADALIDLTDNLHTRMLRWTSGTASWHIDSRTFRKWLLTTAGIDQLENQHFIHRAFDRLQSLGIKEDTLGIYFFIDEHEEVDPEWIPREFRKSYVVFALSAPYATRQLSLEKMIDLCGKINKPVILIGDHTDEQLAKKLSEFFDTKGIEEQLKTMGKKTIIHNMVGQLSIKQTGSVIKHAKFVFGHDDFYIHIAAAFKKPTFTLWGNTIPDFGLFPYRTKFWIYENKTLDCRPCSTHGFKKCPRGHFKCMNDLHFDFYLD